MKSFPFKSCLLFVVLICCLNQAFTQTYTKTQLEQAFTKYQDEFQLLKGHYPTDEIAQFIEEENPDYIYVFESYNLKTAQYSYSIRTYFWEDEKDFSEWGAPTDQPDLAVYPRKTHTYNGEEYPNDFISYDEMIYVKDFGIEYIELNELFVEFGESFSIQPFQPQVLADLGYNDSPKEREKFKQKTLYLDLPIIRTETLIDTQTKTAKQIHSVPLKMKAIIYEVTGEADVCR